MSSDAVRPKQPRDFDPVNFTVVPPRRFEDLHVGDVFRAPSRTLTDAHAAAFQTVSADNHPIHYDVEYARRHGHIAPVVHGLQIFAFTLQVRLSFRNTSATFSVRLPVRHANSSRRCTLEIRSILHWKLSRLHRKATLA
jgi:hypothetical protein